MGAQTCCEYCPSYYLTQITSIEFISILASFPTLNVHFCIYKTTCHNTQYILYYGGGASKEMKTAGDK